MYELKNDEVQTIIEKYDLEGVFYYLLADDKPYQGMVSHKEAVHHAMRQVFDKSVENIKNAEVIYGKEFADKLHPLVYDIDKAWAEIIDSEQFLFVPRLLKKDRLNNTVYDIDYRSLDTSTYLPYWYAFLEPPHEAGCYEPADFQSFNHVLFPHGADTLEVYEWTTDWSDCFDDGHEWWGASCWSVYDKHLNRYVVIFASATD